MKESLGRREYHKYTWKKKELLWAITRCVVLVVAFAYFFYRSVLAMIPLFTLGFLYFRRLEDKKQKEYRQAFVGQFRECMLSVTASMKAGYAVENAFLESREDMRMLYGRESAIYQELELIRRGMVINITLEEQLLDLGKRSGSDEIAQFAEVFCIAKRNSGNLAEIMEASAQLISRRVDAKQEIETLLGGRQMEMNVMRLMPFGVMFYIGVSYPGYFDGLYHNMQGNFIMTGCLLLYLGAYVLGERTMGKIAQELI
ncbi:MAG: type II secretion system F family protein [Lachnospiraceae bacterium]|nr:type II secretion system F family protein [Lachnospiraceae bacterium]